ncbi:unnamed protein product [Closterium sp. Naga37s-1]|nr:unnamed protein product [Closterium sp. Naga37s-1]
MQRGRFNLFRVCSCRSRPVLHAITQIKDAGGVESLSTGQGNAAGKIQVSERVVALERLNPTTRPTSSPLLEGYWDFVWAGAQSPGLIAARLVLQRLPPQVASLQALQLHIMPGSTITATAVVRFLNAAESNVIIKSKLEMEDSLKLKEEYAEIEVTTPIVTGGSIPAPLTAVVDQLSSLLKSLPAALQDTINAGLRVPLGDGVGMGEVWGRGQRGDGGGVGKGGGVGGGEGGVGGRGLIARAPCVVP